jgi:hypothetical protein
VFIKSGPAGDRKTREELRSRLFKNRTVRAFNDSTFIFNEGAAGYLYKDHRLRVIGDHPIDVANAVLIDGELFVLEMNKFVHIHGHHGKRSEVTLAGGKDVSIRGPLSLYTSAYTHIVSQNRLYRLRCPGGARLEAVFVCDLAFLRYPIGKVEYDPRQGVTAFSSKGDGLFIVKPSPFYSERFPAPFLELKKKRIFYPLALKDSNIFITVYSGSARSTGFIFMTRGSTGSTRSRPFPMFLRSILQS